MVEATTFGDSITPGVSDIQILGTGVTTIVLVGDGLVTTGGDIQIFVVHITEIGDGDGIQHFVTIQFIDKVQEQLICHQVATYLRCVDLLIEIQCSDLGLHLDVTTFSQEADQLLHPSERRVLIQDQELGNR